MKRKPFFWIYLGACAFGTGAGSTRFRDARAVHNINIPHGTRLKFAIRDNHGRRVIKTEHDEYFTLDVTNGY